ncbi:MAG: hypothetical protein ACOY90_08380 [Candidatus Zhuqueibacterota bacterium]
MGRFSTYFWAAFFIFINMQIGLASDSDSLIQRGIELSINHRYAEAESIFAQIISENPDQPEGYFFMAATIQSKMMDYESDTWDRDFHHYIELAIATSEKQLAEHPGDNLSLFYQGSALSYLAFYQGRKQEYVAALRNAMAGISRLKRIAGTDPEFADVYFGLGSYKYWWSRATKYLNWLPLLSDDRRDGIRMVERAVEQGQFTRYAAMNELIWMLLDASLSGEAFAWSLRGLEKFPDSRFFLWGAAKSALALDKINDAERYFTRLLNSITAEPINNGYNESICRINLAEINFELKHFEHAQSQLDRLTGMQLAPGIEKRLVDQRERASQLQKKLSKSASQSRASVFENKLTNVQSGK